LLSGSKNFVKNCELFAIELIYLSLHGWILEHLFDQLRMRQWFGCFRYHCFIHSNNRPPEASGGGSSFAEIAKPPEGGLLPEERRG
jgi:hypothetical protein